MVKETLLNCLPFLLWPARLSLTSLCYSLLSCLSHQKGVICLVISTEEVVSSALAACQAPVSTLVTRPVLLFGQSLTGLSLRSHPGCPPGFLYGRSLAGLSSRPHLDLLPYRPHPGLCPGPFPLHGPGLQFLRLIHLRSASLLDFFDFGLSIWNLLLKAGIMSQPSAGVPLPATRVHSSGMFFVLFWT